MSYLGWDREDLQNKERVLHYMISHITLMFGKWYQ